MSRAIKIISTQRNPMSINSSATTWGELRSELMSEISDIDKMTVVVSTTKNSLDHEAAQLPEGEFKLFLSPKAIKAGK